MTGLVDTLESGDALYKQVSLVQLPNGILSFPKTYIL